MKFKSKFRLYRGRTFATSNSEVLNRVAMAAGDGGRNFATPAATVIVMAAKVGSTEQQRSSRSPSPTGASRPDCRPLRLPAATGRPAAALVLWLCLVGW